MIYFAVSIEELRKALNEIELCESNGFDDSVAIFKLIEVGESISDCKSRYEDVSVKGKNSNGQPLCWGRSEIYKNHKLIKGSLTKINNNEKIN